MSWDLISVRPTAQWLTWTLKSSLVGFIRSSSLRLLPQDKLKQETRFLRSTISPRLASFRKVLRFCHGQRDVVPWASRVYNRHRRSAEPERRFVRRWVSPKLILERVLGIWSATSLGTMAPLFQDGWLPLRSRGSVMPVWIEPQNSFHGRALQRWRNSRRSRSARGICNMRAKLGTHIFPNIRWSIRTLS